MLVWFYLLLLPSETEGCTLAGNTEVKVVTTYTGGSVTLPCSCTNLQSKPETVKWQKTASPNPWVEISPESEQYKDRFQLVNNFSPGNLSLLISHLTEEDDGYYRCSVKRGEYRDVRLTVKEAPNTPSTSTRKIIETTSKAGLTNKKNILGANEETSGISGNETPPVVIISSGVAGVLLLLLILILGALMYWKDRGRRRGQTENGDGQTGQKTQQNKQDFSKPLNLTMTSETTEAVHKQNDSDVLYAPINPQTKCNKAEEKDDVTYSTVVHSNTVRAAHTPVTSGDTAVYASIKTN